MPKLSIVTHVIGIYITKKHGLGPEQKHDKIKDKNKTRYSASTKKKWKTRTSQDVRQEEKKIENKKKPDKIEPLRFLICVLCTH